MRAGDPELAAYELINNIPDIVKNCPDSLEEFVNRMMGILKVDNELFTWVGHEYLIEPYRAVHVVGDRNEEGHAVTLMTGAQVGKTVMAMLTMVWLACRFWGKYLGYFFPDRDMAMITSSVRFKPLCLSIPAIAPLWGENPLSDDKTKKKSDAQRVRSIGASQIFFGYMGGKTSTESIPLMGMVFDEVRRMLDSEIELATERMSHSPYPFNVKISTAGYPEVTIDRYFRRSTQHKFHSACKCSDGIVLVDHFPNCVGERAPGLTPGLASLPRFFWVCPRCNEPIINPRTGKWIPHNPTAKDPGYHIPQILSSRQSAAKIFNAYMEATDIIEFYNSKLGKPHITAEAQIVNPDILRLTVDDKLRWAAPSGVYPRNCAMGVDQMLGFNVVVIRRLGEVMANGMRESVLVHLEWIEEPGNLEFDPWVRCAELIKIYDVGCCVIDSMPNANEALRFANSEGLRGKVFLADYSYEAQTGEDIAIWGDKVLSDPNRKADKEIKSKFRVRISRFHALEWNLMRYVKRIKRQPHERALIGLHPDRLKKMVKSFVCDLFWKHLQSVARRKIHVIESINIGGQQHRIDQGKIKMVFENVGCDPHYLHADTYCELALTRISEGGGAFSDYAVADKPKDTDHRFIQDAVHLDHWRCEACGITVAAPMGTTPSEVAAKAGMAECEAAKK